MIFFMPTRGSLRSPWAIQIKPLRGLMSSGAFGSPGNALSRGFSFFRATQKPFVLQALCPPYSRRGTRGYPPTEKNASWVDRRLQHGTESRHHPTDLLDAPRCAPIGNRVLYPLVTVGGMTYCGVSCARAGDAADRIPSRADVVSLAVVPIRARRLPSQRSCCAE
jgi:hypothetical protein